MPTKVGDVLEAFISTSAGVTTDTQDVSLTKIDRSAFLLHLIREHKDNSQYYVDRQNVPIINLYLTPDASTFTHLKYFSINRIEDAGAYTNTADVAYRFYRVYVLV